MIDDLVKRLLTPVIDPFLGPLIEPIKKEAADFIEKQQQYISVYQDQINILLTRIKELEEEKDD